MGEFLTIVLGTFVGLLTLYLIGCMVLAFAAPRRFEAYKAWNLRKAAERKTTRTKKRRVRELPVPLPAPKQREARLGATGVRYHHDPGDPLLHGVVAGAAATSLRDDIEEAIIRETISSDRSDEHQERSADW